jgi:lipid A disaccharide synthetase
MVKLPYISPVNIISGEKIVPEYIQNMPYGKIKKDCIMLIDDKREIEKQKEEFKKIKEICGKPSVSKRVSEFILKNA